MRKLFSILFLLSIALTGWADDSDYYVESWDYLAIVHEDNTWDVRERIEVNFVQPHHGIFVYKPMLFSDRHVLDGVEQSYLYKLEIEDVKVPGQNYITDTNDDSQSNYIIQIGDADIELTGHQTYNISYRLVYPDDRYAERDNVFHSVLGDGWPSSIKHFTFEVRFDKAIPEESQDECYIFSGPWNSLEDQLCVADSSYIDDYCISGAVDDIAGYQAITFRLALPEGYFVDVPVRHPWLPYLLYGAAFLLSLWLIYVLFAVKIEYPVPSVEFYPPEGITGAEVGTIIDNSADVEDLVSLIPWYAQHGYIEIDEKEEGSLFKKSVVTLRQKKPLPDNAPEYQKLFLTALFPKGTTTKLNELGDRHTQIESATNSLKGVFSGERSLTNSDYRWLFVPLILILLLLGYTTDTQVSFYDSDKFFIGLVAASIQGGLAIWRMSFADRRSFKKSSSLWSIIGICLVAFLHLICLWADDQPQNYFMPVTAVVVCFAVSYLVILLSDRFFTDTPYRLKITGQLLGLREFIQTAEKDRLEMLVNEQPEYFYNVLPYAMVFGLAEKWADKFKDINIATPNWYHGDSAMMHNMMGSHIASSLTHSLSSTVVSAVSSSSHAPSSSSGGSGGGGGGGGGGAW